MRNKSYPYTLKLFYPTGDPQNICLIEKTNWSGLGVVFRRSSFENVIDRVEIDKPGIYLLIQSNTADLPELYIGEADPLRARLINHYRNKEFWEWGIFFVSKDDSLNKAHVKYLEASLCRLAKRLNQCVLNNTQSPNPSNISESEQVDLDIFMTTMISIFPSVGIHCFVPTEQRKNQELFTIQQPNRGINATGFESKHGFVVCQGSIVRAMTTLSFSESLAKLRQRYIEQGVIQERNGSFILTQDITFNSPSTAASIVMGASANGRTEWKNHAGVTLKAIQLKAIEEVANTFDKIH